MSLTIKQAFEALSDACANGMKNPFFVMRRLKESFADVASKVVDASGDKVTVTPITDSGTKIASIKVNNTTSNLYAPAGGGIDFSETEQDTGLIWIDGKPLYQKTVDIAQYDVTLSDDAWSNIFTITGLNYLVSATIHSQSPNVGQQLRFFASNSYIQGASSTSINLTTFANMYVTFQYTKTES